MRLVDADALRDGRKLYRWEGRTGQVAAVPYAVALEDIDAAPTVAPTIHVRYDNEGDFWTNTEAVQLFADTDGYLDYPVKLVVAP
jgi:hypothetical protein